MRPGVIEGHTHCFGKPGDMSDEECFALHVRMGNFNGLDQLTSAWFPTPDELQRLNDGAPVLLSIIGGGHPPVMLEVGENSL